MQYEPLGHIPLLVYWPGVPGGTTARRVDDQRRHPRHHRRRVRRHAARRGARRVARPAGARRSGAGAGVGHRRRLRQLGPGHRRPAQVRPRRRRRRTSPSPCGRTGGRPCPSTAWRTWSACRRPTGAPAWTILPGTDIPVIRQPFEPGDRLPFWVGHNVVDAHFLFDLTSDPDEDENRAGTGSAEESDMVELLRAALQDVAAPAGAAASGSGSRDGRGRGRGRTTTAMRRPSSCRASRRRPAH